MKTNTLLAAAAILAVGGLAAQAQVYSQNVVGYYNVTLPSHGFALVGNQLINGSDANQTNNSVSTAFTGLTSDPNGATNTVIYLFSGGNFSSYQYFSGADADNNFFASGSAAGFYDTVGNLLTAPLSQGVGAFLYNPNAGSVTATVVGTVPQTTNVISIASGFNLLSLPVPVSTNLESSIGGFAGTSDPNAVNNDVLFLFNGGGYSSYQYFTGADADNNFFASGSVTGFYDTVGNRVTSATLVGQGFYLQHVVAGTEKWTNSFTVQ